MFYALGARRMVESEHAVAYGVNGPELWFVVRGRRRPAPGYGHLALRGERQGGGRRRVRGGLANGGGEDGPPGQRPQYGRRYYAAYLLDPDGLRVEVVSDVDR